MSFVHLHNHTHYSLLDGLSKPADLVKIAQDNNMPAMAITDHGVVYGAIEFYKLAKANGIKPIIGCELYITNDRFKKDSSVKKANHLLVLAKNNTGYKNLLKLVTKAHLEGFYYKPRIDHELLKKHSEGLIATSGCMQAEIPMALLANDKKTAKEMAKQYIDIFGKENFFIEVQSHQDIDDQIILNNKLIDLAEEMDIPLVATNDCHYPCKEDAAAHDILVCIQTGRTLLDDNRMTYDSNFSIKSPEEMKEAFKSHPEAIENTVKIAEMCDLEIEFDQNLLPHFPVPKGKTSNEYLNELCITGLKERYEGDTLNEAMERLSYELGIIDKMGFSDYFLIVRDIIKFAKDSGIVVGPGRGSAAGSIIAYSLNITTVDPLKYGLLFERFLNPERISMPDIDIDFADHRRNEVFDYVKQKYGEENVAQVITFGKMTAKAAVRDVGRAMGYPYAEVDKIAKLVPPPILGKHRPLAESKEQDPGLSDEYKKNPRAKALLDNAIKIEGTIRNAGTHACAVVVSEEPLTNFTALQYASGKDDAIVTQYSMGPLEDIGLLKVDFLGLRNLTILEHSLNIIKARHDVDIDLSAIPLDDKKTFELLSRGETTGVFQLESAGMRRYLKDLKPTRLQDIVAMNALYRPGPMEYIPSYIKGKHKPETVKYMHPLFEEILSETYGIGVYQEQILEIARVFAGFTLGEADLLRKAVGKKIPKLLAEQRTKFVEGAVSEGHEKSTAEKVFDDVIEPFAGYGFNKAHATCYAMIAYQTAYLKAHYPTEFMAALLTADKENTDRVVLDIAECKAMGVEVLPPSINESYNDFTVVKENQIRFGLTAIKGVGGSTVDRIIEARKEKGKFTSIEDFLVKVPSELINKKTVESLAYSGALDDFGERGQLALGYDVIAKFAKAQAKNANDGQTDIFGMMTEEEGADFSSLDLPEVESLPRMEALKLEKKYLGLYVSGHPLEGLSRYISTKARLVKSLKPKDIGQNLTVSGIIVSSNRIVTRKGDYMMYATLEDPTGEIELVIFPKNYNNLADVFEEDSVVLVEGRLEERRNRQVIVRNAKKISIKSMKENAEEMGIFGMEADIESDDEESKEEIVITVPGDASKADLGKLKNILNDNKGNVKVLLQFTDGKEITRKVKLSDGINLSDSVKKEIEEMFEIE